MREREYSAHMEMIMRQARQIKPPFVVSKEQQEKRLEVMQQTVNAQRFSFVVQLSDFSLRHVMGVHNWLGYQHFDMRKYLEATDYEHQPMLNYVSQVLVEDITLGKIPMRFDEHKFVAKHTIRHADGQLISTHRISSVWQHNDKNQVTAYLNEFTILGNGYLPTDPYTANNRGRLNDDPTGLIQRARERAVLELIDKYQVLTHREFTKILLPFSEGKTTAEVARMLSTPNKKISESRLLDIRKGILLKVKAHFERPFHGGIAELIEFFQAEGLIARK